MTVLRKDVTHPARDLAADGDGAVAVLHLTATDDDIFRRHGHASPVVIAAGVDRYAVITGGEYTFLDQDIAA